MLDGLPSNNLTSYREGGELEPIQWHSTAATALELYAFLSQLFGESLCFPVQGVPKMPNFTKLYIL